VTLASHCMVYKNGRKINNKIIGYLVMNIVMVL
jgi:hypothetical protein